jgi:hypothetical protein
MAFNLDHTASGDITLAGSHYAFTGVFNVPLVQCATNEVVFLVENSPISAISGLQDELDLKQDSTGLFSASSFNCGNSCNEIPVIGVGDVLSEQIFPKLASTTMFVKTNTGQLISISDAGKGDFATVTSPSGRTYVLCDADYTNINNWILLQDPGNCINSVNTLTGNVTLNACNVLVDSTGLAVASGSALDFYLQDLYTGKFDAEALSTGYYQIYGVGNFEDIICCYVTSANTTSCLSCFLTTGGLHDTLVDYSNDTCLTGSTGLLIDYVLKSATGNVAYGKNTGISQCDILTVEADGYISKDVLPTLALVTTWNITGTGDLVALSTSCKGDIAVDSTHLKNYILTETGASAYSDINNWAELVGNIGTVHYIDGQGADAYGNVCIDASHIPYFGSGTGFHTYHIDKQIENTVSGLSSIMQTYQDCTCFTGLVDSDYVPTSLFNNILDTKSVTGHQHVSGDVEDLSSCLDSIHAFKQGDLINLQESFSAKLDPNSANTQYATLMLGAEAKATVNSEIVIGAGKFVEIGDAQASEVVFYGSTSNATWTALANYDSQNIPVEANSAVLVNADVVGMGTTDRSIYASFRLEGLLVKEDGSVSLADEFEKTVITRSSGVYDARMKVSTDSFNIEVKGDSSNSVRWVANINSVKVKGEPVSGNGPGVYFYADEGNDWYSVSNWWIDGGHTVAASALPTSSSNVEMLTAAYVDLDCESWVKPASIDTTAVSDTAGICFYSNSAAAFDGTVYGNASFYGNATLN